MRRFGSLLYFFIITYQDGTKHFNEDYCYFLFLEMLKVEDNFLKGFSKQVLVFYIAQGRTWKGGGGGFELFYLTPLI